MKRIALACIALALVGVGVVAWTASALWTPPRRALDGDPGTVDFQVRNGESLIEVARRLEAEALLPGRWPFGPRVLVLYARARGIDRDVKSGEYALSRRMTPVAILEKLVAGTVKTYAVTLPEGLRLDEVAQRLEAAGIVDADAFVARARNPEFAKALDVEADTLEGYLYPETYRFPRNAPVDQVVERMVREFQARWEIGDDALERTGLTPHQVVTLASIVEKETGHAEERRLIAAVFHNRLRRRMRLQSDPTVIYGILETRGSFDGNIRKRDLQEDTPWNTYTRGGLPPGPIASAGIDSIRAVLEPAEVPYLYFVSRNDGTHVFSKTLAEHTRAVNEYQRRRRRSPS